jgi:hypothetical protein
MAVGTEGSDSAPVSLASEATKTASTTPEVRGGDNQSQAAAQGKPWHDGLPKEIVAVVGKFTSKEELAKGYVNLQTKVHGWPGDDATEEAKQEYYKRVARPDSADGYQIEAAPLPDGSAYPEGSDSRFKKACWEAGLSPAQAKLLYKTATQEIADGYRDEVAGKKKALETATQTLRQAWGKEFEPNLALMGRVGARFAPPSLLKRWDESGMGNDPDHIAFLVSIGHAMSEGTLQGGMGPSSRSSGTVDAQAIERGEAYKAFPNTPQFRPQQGR